ncbi:MAG TPA: riboflavin synthase [Acidobacteriaceae bacterium]|jgi:riboflavin synthase
MFTGLIQETGSVLAVEQRGGVHHITVHAPTLAPQLHLGDSIAVSGVCLTALAIAPEGEPNRFEADLAEETVRRTSLSQLAPGAVVNLELPTPAGTPLGGHVVQGHVDGVGRLLTLRPVAPDNEMTDWWLEVEVPEGIRPYVVEKGSIAIEGISLTVAAWDGARASVAIIPHTYQHTNLRIHQAGDLLNLEADVLLRHAAQIRVTQIRATQIGATQIGATQTLAREKSPELTLAYLITNGY